MGEACGLSIDGCPTFLGGRIESAANKLAFVKETNPAINKRKLTRDIGLFIENLPMAYRRYHDSFIVAGQRRLTVPVHGNQSSICGGNILVGGGQPVSSRSKASWWPLTEAN